ncbi:MAG: FAD-dependent oxidoreductase [Planctomycetaceae bacterium]|nr:FAD-dependent oxidoreductase [Planctomycetaceae bacterium]
MTASASSEEVVIVGSGIIGIACAHYLNRAGLSVTVIDKGSLAGGCSHGNCGYICPSHVLPLTEPGAIKTALKSLFRPSAPFRVKPRLSPPLWNWMWQFARRCHHGQMLTAGGHLKTILDASLVEYHQLMREEALACDWTENGLLYVLQTAHGMHEFAETDRLLSEHFGVHARRIEGRELPEFDPALKPGLAGAFLYEHDVSMRPDRLNASWAARLRERGVRFIEECELQGVERNEGNVIGLKTSQGPFAVSRLVVAAGALSARLSSMLDCHIPVEPGKGYSVTMDRPEICPKHPMLFPEHRVGVSPFSDGYRLGSMMEFVGFDTSIPERRIQQLRDSAAPYLVNPVGKGRQEAWYGWRPMTWDSLPIIGAVPRLSNAWLATGHNMLGMSLATSTGRLISEMIVGQPPHIDPAPFSPARF